jgi:proteasome accessory factor B
MARLVLTLRDEGGPHDIVVEFSAEKAPLVSSRRWHPSQRVTKQQDGSVRIAFSATSLAPIVSWVLEWGPHAQAIAPTELVDEVTRELTQALKHYR